MNKPVLLLVGRSFRTLREYLNGHGFEYITLKDTRLLKAPSVRKRQVPCDFSSKESMLKAVDEVANKHHVAGLLVSYENYVVPAAELAAYLRLPGMLIEAAQACTDKYIMRKKFAAAPETISPEFKIVKNEHDVRTFAAAHSFPLILKPANLAKSLLVFKNDSLAQLMTNYQRMLETIDAVYQKYAPHSQPKILIEEFMQGPVHSVDAFVDHEGTPHVLEQVVDYQTGYDIGYEDNFHYSRLIPSKLPEHEVAAIRRVAGVGCRALGMRSSPAHIEIIHTKDGPRIVEIGARNGGYRERMHRLANGIDITRAAITLALGEKPELHASKNEPCAVLELFPKQPGLFAGIANEEKLRNLKSFHSLSIKVKPGEFVGKAADGFKMCAIVILHYNDQAQFNNDLKFLNKNAYVLTNS